MKIKRNVLYGLVILLAGVIYFAVQAQQKKGIHRADFSGEWKAKESISMGGNIVCSYNGSDRMLSNTMKIAQQAGFLTIESSNAAKGTALAAGREKLAFDGKETQITSGPASGKKFTVTFSPDGQTMTVNSTVYFMTATPYHVNVQQQAFVYVTEVWNLSNDGKCLIVQASAKSNIFEDGRSWKTVFNRVN